MPPQNKYTGTSTITRTKNNFRLILFVALGLILVMLHLVLMFLSHNFSEEFSLPDKPVLTFVALELAAAAIFLIALITMRSMRSNGSILIFVILSGLLMRAPITASTPILENDFNRYLLDGAVLANGYNPYRYCPTDVQASAEHVPVSVLNTAKDGKNVIDNINYPHIRTIYPPVAQATFALAYFIKPWSLYAWRLVICLFDITTVILLLIALHGLGLPSLWIAVYWWNPLVIRELFNSAHMDVIILPFVISALLLSARRYHVLAFTALALATGTKLWPILLLPILLWPIRRQIRSLLTSLAVFGAICGLLCIPVCMSGLDDSSGFIAYGRVWEMNDALYMVFFWSAGYIASLIGYCFHTAHLVTRLIMGIILVIWIAWVMRNEHSNQIQMWEKALLIVTGLFMLSPTQFPWYYVWVIPFLTVRPRVSLLILSALLPFYYARFYFQAHGDVHTFDNYLVWLQYMPVWILIGWEVCRAQKGVSPYLSASRFRAA